MKIDERIKDKKELRDLLVIESLKNIDKIYAKLGHRTQTFEDMKLSRAITKYKKHDDMNAFWTILKKSSDLEKTLDDNKTTH